jgi:hypothetical protein
MNIIQDLTAVHFTVPTWKKRNLVIIIHSMDGFYQGSISWFRNPKSGGSTQYLISKEGEVRQMVRDDHSSWNCMGMTSEYGAKTYWNDISLSIELEDEGKRGDWRYTDAQIKALRELCDMKSAQYGIPLDEKHVLLHKNLDPARRSDPVGNFDIKWVFAITPPPVTGGSMSPDFKSLVLKVAKDIYGDSYNEGWNDAEKKVFLDKFEQKCRDYKARAEAPAPAPAPVVTGPQSVADCFILAGKLLKEGKLI